MYQNMPHLGEIVTKAIAQKGFSKASVARGISLSRHGLDYQLDRANMKLGYILKIGDYIGVDFLDLIPSLKKEAIDLKTVQEQEQEFDLKDSIEMKVRLDGSESTLRHLIAKLTRINESISS